jgi:hypothetical protein
MNRSFKLRGITLGTIFPVLSLSLQYPKQKQICDISNYLISPEAKEGYILVITE